jgi:hypothetical protein
MFLNEFRDSNYTRQASEEELTTNSSMYYYNIPELGRSHDPSRGIDPGPRTWPPVPARYR